MHAESCVLVCGSFPPVKKSVKFYYPNANNDMWRVLGEVFFHDQTHFYTDVEIKKPSKGRRKGSVRVARCLNEAEMRNFVVSQPIGFFDVCKRIRRQRGNSSDNNIETLERTDVFRDALTHTPHCEAIITTGTLALTMLLDALHTCGSFVSDSGEVVKAIARNKLGKVTYSIPRVGGKLRWAPNTTAPYHRALWIYRAPSTSRALPLKLADKIALYRTMFAAHLHLA
ncbi:hypothetical protein ABB37_01065 [Leptomonas pyrrhocoris]|uniref:Uracil-DNA glycosylase-like domain-containing protein n=1 Tax=Leptomonas pyrrhocoris TaxID=157538 RepID=A0A0N0VH24_LEPPY|nr:hypothetical protein ABB37_01065 [Leptomonas pyrrhocoris]XP_015662960.1 hypothetical protein ABB37_01065 [Leptomonas pyrrhocoris]XP_015662961.1 hypothetical protein ABB37_01065 [Leptomonas pyrrhocoris]KPA84520.1 hypothetical protein ABB37_01065 [Leptomonas pyrrhocoris]KPA84521.1 hypothetical protein ABB37_01065 [Leptomonas pyrrhocoris]KPA84522.1 hypothetical protein ABB37_01065 [Leptomonas pyrrhocoris]|eukprot:XP_015662959.1 hypothetical protein ABB37_01065 [Leptomonas pyrrhocoris]